MRILPPRATGHGAVEVDVLDERLAPGVQDGEESELAFELPLGIAGKLLEGGVDFAKEEVEQRLAVVAQQRVGSCGRVKTTWKYGAGISSRMRRASHFSRAAPWQVGQCRSRQEL
ncbi:MAG: hypothetical protein M5U15_14160 [Kiritimatiellae bacterium]|nr:hypothetical protein [Kiritimatiellia bacterium]